MSDLQVLLRNLNKKEKKKLFDMNMRLYAISATKGDQEDFKNIIAEMQEFETKMEKKYDPDKNK